ncbi:MAG: tRNA epoxyqueuosine(34) reductase QueG [Candidatus Marinimicrobia bacterium]|nr:tRNA epoxyqueuosine(34) reductase QueG [Candidatus Neomarinimicrobiota bacterium]MDP6339818.1 tRNA epoxyqueuosine(34) reductase QueG [Candidatus Neomarinimicrobiota bacterium]MDP6611606.1 tRNA epoxyqueuosine(34) reductase QueG [Candidatus Neomarinimicrobiota bacterium]
MILSQSIKKKALELGFQKVGIAKAEGTPEAKSNLYNWLNSGSHATMDWMAKREEERGDIQTYFPEARSVISVGINYFSGHSQSELKANFKFSNYAWGDDYHDVLKKRLFQLLGFIKEKSPEVKTVVSVDTSPVMDKVWAQKAGIGWQGKHTNLITRDYGSWLFLGELIVDLELDYDSPFDEDLCGTCTACIEACPTEALSSYQIDSEKCISYRTIEHKGKFSEGEDDLDDWIYGCDICQDVCPWNQKFGQVTDEPAFLPRQEILTWTDSDWTTMDEAGFRKLSKGSAVKRTKFSGLNRNIKQNSL